MTLGTKPPIAPDTPKPEDVLLEQRITELDQQAEQTEQLAKSGSWEIFQQEMITGTIGTTQQKLYKETASARAKAKLLRDFRQEEKRVANIEKFAESGKIVVSQVDIDKAKIQLEQQGDVLNALTSKELSPYIEVKEDGSYSINVDAALKAGVNRKTLLTAGTKPTEIYLAKQRIKKGKPAPVSAEKAGIIKAAEQFVSQQALARFKRTHKQLPDGEWIDILTLKTMEKESPEVYKRLVSKGFDAANEYIQWSNEKFEKAAETLEDYPYMITTYDKSGKPTERPSKGGQIDTVAAVKAGKEAEIALILGPEAVVEAQEYIKAEKEYEKEYTEWLDKQPKNAAQAIWRALTPWNEEKDETFGSYIVNTPNRLFHPELASQAELKKQYEEERNSPLWARVVFGGDTVIKTKDAKGNVIYTQTVTGYVPIAPAGTGTIPINFNKIANQIRQARLAKNWKGVVGAIRRGNIDDTASSVRWMRTNTSVNVRPPAQGFSGYISETAADQLAREIRVFKDMEWVKNIQAAMQVQKAAKSAQLAKELAAIKVIGIPNPGIITRIQLDTIVERLTKVKPAVAIQQLTEAKLIPAAMVSNPQAMVKMLTSVSPKDMEQVQTQLKTMTQQLTAVDVLTATQAKELTKTLEQIQSAVQTRTQLQLKAQAQQATATRIDTLKPAQAKTPLQRVGMQKTATLGTPARLSPRPASDKEKRKRIRKANVALGWRQGELHGKHRWDVLVDPFSAKEQYLVVIGSKPRGMGPPLRGPRSAYNTAQTTTGHLGKAGIIDLPGIMSVKLWPLEGKKKIGIQFQRDADIGKKGKVFPLPKGRTA